MTFSTTNIWTRASFMQSPKELNENIGKAVYIVFQNEFLLASTKKSEIDDYLEEEEIIERFGESPEEVEVIYGLVLNPKSLPSKNPRMTSDSRIYVIFPDNNVIDYRDEDNIEDAIKVIEAVMEINTNLDIEEVSVVYGLPVRLKLQTITPESLIVAKDRKEFGVFNA